MTYEILFAEREPEREPGPAAHRRSDGTWACVRRDYLAGEAAPRLAERYGVSVSTIRTRARDEGWRRADLPDPEPLGDEDDLSAAADAAPAELRALAWARAAAAVRRGRLAEALGWTRLVRQLDLMVAREAATPALQARAADSLARAADTLAALRKPGEAPRPEACEEDATLVLPRSRERWRAPQARDGGGDADPSDDLKAPPGGLDEGEAMNVFPCGASTPDVGATPSTAFGAPLPPQAGEDEDVHDLHDLHAAGCAPPLSSRPERSGEPAAATVTPGSRIGCAVRDDSQVADQDASAGPSPLAPRPSPPRGPAVPPVPPAWVRHALYAR